MNRVVTATGVECGRPRWFPCLTGPCAGIVPPRGKEKLTRCGRGAGRWTTRCRVRPGHLGRRRAAGSACPPAPEARTSGQSGSAGAIAVGGTSPASPGCSTTMVNRTGPSPAPA